MMPQATPKLTPEELASNPKEAVLKALRTDVNLLSGNWQRSPAEHFFVRPILMRFVRRCPISYTGRVGLPIEFAGF